MTDSTAVSLTPNEMAQAEKVEEVKQEKIKKKEVAVEKLKVFSASPIGEKINSGEELTPAEIIEAAEVIPAPIPVIQDVTESGAIKMTFTKPIAVPTKKKKTEMVGLLLENDMIEMSLSNADSGSVIMGEPYFDEESFAAEPVSEVALGRRLNEDDRSLVDPETQ